MSEITMEMRKYFSERTKRHKSLVEKYFLGLVGDRYKDYIETHDNNKFYYPQVNPYIYLTWSKKEKIEMPGDVKRLVHQATIHHITTNPHHPEFWDNDFCVSMLNYQNRDKPSGHIVNACKMPDFFIREMCADWMAMSEEMAGDPIEWANENVGTRWDFSCSQIDLIYSCLNRYKDIK